MQFLVTNDDGVDARGLLVLVEGLSRVGQVTVVAPDRERSAVGHGLTFHTPLRIEMVCERTNYRIYKATGTPADCILLGMLELMKHRPDFVVSGINQGANLGEDVIYSGTVAGAREGYIQGCSALAVSLSGRGSGLRYGVAAEFVVRLIRCLSARRLSPAILLNINVPDIPREKLRGVEVTRQGRTVYRQRIERRVDPRGKEYYWVTGDKPVGEPRNGTDYWAIQNNYISVTPLGTDLTELSLIEELKQWQI